MEAKSPGWFCAPSNNNNNNHINTVAAESWARPCGTGVEQHPEPNRVGPNAWRVAPRAKMSEGENTQTCQPEGKSMNEKNENWLWNCCLLLLPSNSSQVSVTKNLSQREAMACQLLGSAY